MFRTLKDLENYEIGATDGSIGRVLDFYFDDHDWVVRYLVVDAGTWLTSREVLISPPIHSRPGLEPSTSAGVTYQGAGQKQSQH